MLNSSEMSNPFYLLLVQLQSRNLHLEFKHKQSEGKSYFLEKLNKPAKPYLILNGKKYTLYEHHLSIYEKYIKGTTHLSPIHYTVIFLLNRRKVKLHVFLNDTAEVLACEVDYLVSEFDPAFSSKEIEEIKCFAEAAYGEVFSPLSEQLLKAQAKNNQSQDDILTELTRESRNGVKTKIYIDLLIDSIKTLKKYAEMEFDADYSVINILQRNLLYLQTSTADGDARNKNSSVDLAEDMSDVFEENVQECNSLEVKETNAIPPLNNARIVSSLSQNDDNADLEEKERHIHAELDKLPPDAIGRIQRLFKKLDALEQSRVKVLIKACIAHDIVTFKKNFPKIRKSNYRAILVLLSTSIYHNNLPCYAYLDREVKNIYLKKYLYMKPVVTLEPYTLPRFHNVSYLTLAYGVGNLMFFKLLTEKFHHNLNLEIFTKCSLLMQMAVNKESHEYMRLALKSGANPDAVKPLYDLPSGSDIQTDWGKATPLHYAASEVNDKAIQVLLEFGANSFLEDHQHHTPFGVYLSRVHLDKKIVEAFLSKGHDIEKPCYTISNRKKKKDTRVTPLFLACHYNEVSAVRVLLECKADPNGLASAGSDVNINWGKKSPLHFVAGLGYEEIINLLLEFGANSFLENKADLTPFQLYLEREDIQTSTVQAFLNKGHMIDVRYQVHCLSDPAKHCDVSVTALYFACQRNDLSAVKVLLECKADPYAEHTTYLQTETTEFSIPTSPENIATLKGHWDIVAEIRKFMNPSKADVMDETRIIHLNVVEENGEIKVVRKPKQKSKKNVKQQVTEVLEQKAEHSMVQQKAEESVEGSVVKQKAEERVEESVAQQKAEKSVEESVVKQKAEERVEESVAQQKAEERVEESVIQQKAEESVEESVVKQNPEQKATADVSLVKQNDALFAEPLPQSSLHKRSATISKYSILSGGLTFFGGITGYMLGGPVFAVTGIVGGYLAAKTPAIAETCCNKTKKRN